MNEKIILELWNHGTAGNTEKPCGEPIIFSITGECVDWGLIDLLMDEGDECLRVQTFAELPTEKALKVSVDVSREDDGIALIVTDFQELDSF